MLTNRREEALSETGSLSEPENDLIIYGENVSSKTKHTQKDGSAKIKIPSTPCHVMY